MENENEFKNLFKKSVLNCKGYCLSLAAPMIAGLPDLFVVIPSYMPILLEAKFLGEIKRDKFSRKIPFREMQIYWINKCDSVLPYSAMGLIGFYYQEELYSVLVKYGTPHFYTINSSFLTDCAWVKLHNKSFNVTELFHKVPIPRIDNTKSSESINAKMAL